MIRQVLFGFLGFAFPVAAQADPVSLVERVQAIDPAAVEAGDCEVVVSQANSLNGPDLLIGAAVCEAAGLKAETSFLLNVGQSRSVADLMLFVPATKADSDKATELYGFIYYYAGGPGPDEVFRDGALREKFFALYDSWQPLYGPEYNPGWDARRRPETSTYRSAIEESQLGRRQQLNTLIQLYSDETYYLLHERFQDLQARTAGVYTEGSTDADLANELQRQLSKRAAELGLGGNLDETDSIDEQEPAMAPDTPQGDEVAIHGTDDPTAQRCFLMAERLAIGMDGEVSRMLVTYSSEWGTIWRADIVGAERESQRFTCTEYSSSLRPLNMESETLDPLPSAPIPADVAAPNTPKHR